VSSRAMVKRSARDGEKCVWQIEIETLERTSWKCLQAKPAAVNDRQASKSPFYSQKRLKPFLGESFPTLTGSRSFLHQKADLREPVPLRHARVPPGRGDTAPLLLGHHGNPTVIYHTQKNIEHWQDMLARCMFHGGGMRKKTWFQNMMGYGLFTGARIHYGAENSAPSPSHRPRQQQAPDLVHAGLKTTAVHVLTSYRAQLSRFFRNEINPRRDLFLRMAFVGADAP